MRPDIYEGEMAGLQVKSSPRAAGLAVADNVWLDVGRGWMAYNWFYLAVAAKVAVMETIGWHASSRTTLGRKERRAELDAAAAAAATATFGCQLVCTILLFAQNYHPKIAVLTNTPLPPPSTPHDWPSAAVANNRVRDSANTDRARPSRFVPFSALLRLLLNSMRHYANDFAGVQVDAREGSKDLGVQSIRKGEMKCVEIT